MSWVKKKLCEVCTIRPPKSEAKNTLLSNELVSFIGMEHLGINQKFTVPSVEKPLVDVLGGYTYFAENDVLLAKITPCFENGKLGIAKNLTNRVGFGSSEFIVFRANEELSNEWLYYFLSRHQFLQEGANNMSGAVGHKRVNKEFIENYEIPLPMLPIQQKMVAKLDAIFAEIGKAMAAAEANIKNAEALFQSYLTEVFEKIKRESSSVKFGELANFRNGINFRTSSSGIPVKIFGVRNFKNHFSAPLNDLDEINLDKNLPKDDLIQSGDILFVRSNGNSELIGRCVLFKNVKEEITFSGFTIRSRLTTNRIFPEFIMYFLKSEKVRKKMIDGGNGANIKSLNQTTLNSLDIPIPDSLDLQKKIIDNFDLLEIEKFKLIESYKLKVKNLSDYKNSILQQTFSGELVKE